MEALKAQHEAAEEKRRRKEEERRIDEEARKTKAVLEVSPIAAADRDCRPTY
jgi:hypothetical protein